MDRREFLKDVAIGAVALGIAGKTFSNDKVYAADADSKTCEIVNRAKDPANKSALEMKHVPIIKAPAEVKAGTPFMVGVDVGEILHDMGPTHWIQYVELNIGNEPAGRLDFQPKGYLKPKVVFTVVVGKDLAQSGKATLVALERCNLHGCWENAVDVKVTA